jgi:hypothetical protein
MELKLPEISFPLSIGTVGIVLATGHEILAHCCTNGCRHNGRVNLVKVARKSPLGMQQGTLRHELLPFVFCPACDAAGRDRKNLNFSLCIPEPHCRLPRKEHERMEMAKRARGGEN